jgi:hypothetical protein
VSDRVLGPVREAFAYAHPERVQLVLHGLDHKDDRVAELTPMQALRLAETLVRSARDILEAPDLTGLEVRGG